MKRVNPFVMLLLAAFSLVLFATVMGSCNKSSDPGQDECYTCQVNELEVVTTETFMGTGTGWVKDIDSTQSYSTTQMCDIDEWSGTLEESETTTGREYHRYYLKTYECDP